MTFDQLYNKLQADAQANGSVNGQVWHEADIDGFHLYMADTSFGDGPVFTISGHGRMHGWQSPEASWLPFTINTNDGDARFALELAERADWDYRLHKLDPSTR